MRGSAADHLNLCLAFEFLIVEKCLIPELLPDDLRRIPRSFFILREVPNHIDGVITLWLSKFPCMPELHESGPDVQRGIAQRTHVACALAWVYLATIWKAEIKKQPGLSEAHKLAFPASDLMPFH
jgi:hypothetical protein